MRYFCQQNFSSGENLLVCQAKYDQHQAARRAEVLPRVRSSNDLRMMSHHLGVPHLPHSKSDANLLVNGGFPQLPDARASGGNGHLLLQDWQGARGDHVTLIPQTDNKSSTLSNNYHHQTQVPNFQRPDDSQNVSNLHSRSGMPQNSSTLHSRSVFHV